MAESTKAKELFATLPEEEKEAARQTERAACMTRENDELRRDLRNATTQLQELREAQQGLATKSAVRVLSLHARTLLFLCFNDTDRPCYPFRILL